MQEGMLLCQCCAQGLPRIESKQLSCIVFPDLNDVCAGYGGTLFSILCQNGASAPDN